MSFKIFLAWQVQGFLPQMFPVQGVGAKTFFSPIKHLFTTVVE